jgi:S-adenosylmethionine decarboxylase
MPIVVEPKDHFITRDGIKFAGTHLIIDLWEAEGLGDRDHLENVLIKAVEAAKATLLHIHLHVFGDGGGISGVAVLAESHISVHTWPEVGYAAFDIFMCGDADPGAARDVIKSSFGLRTSFIVGAHKRGMLPPPKPTSIR